MAKGNYTGTLRACIKVSESDGSFQTAQNAVRMNIWHHEGGLAKDFYPADETPITYAEMQVGTEAYNNENGSTDDDENNEQTGSTDNEENKDNESDVTPPQTGDISMIVAIAVTGVAVFGSYKARKK